MNDGLVLATDSASTIIGQSPMGQTGVTNVYNNANKLFNLYKGLPIGAITWGAGSIGLSSIATLAKDFRKDISPNGSLEIKPNSYTIHEVADKFKQFIYDDRYVGAFKDWPNKPSIGFMIVGYSAGRPLAEEWEIMIENGQCSGSQLVRGENEVGARANGMPDAFSRLCLGYSIGLLDVLKDAGLDQAMVDKIKTMCQQKLEIPVAIPPMPIQDAIDLAIFLAETTINFVKFSPVAPIVGGPIEVAAITKHEGFKWIQRKYYYNSNFNQNIGV